MFGKILIYAIVAVLTVLAVNPPLFMYVYFLTRPLFQPFAMERMLVMGIPLTGFMALQLTGFTILWAVLRKDFSFRVPNIMPLYLWLFIALLSIANSISLYDSVAGFAKIVTAVMSYVLVYNIIKTEDDARKLLFVIVLATLIPMLVGYYQYIADAGGRSFGEEWNRPSGTLGLANAYGIFLALSLIAVLMLLLQPRWRVSKYYLGAVLASIVVSSVIALNRGTWIALSLGVAIASILYIRKIKIRWILLGVLAVASVFSGIIVDRFMQLEENKAVYYETNTLDLRINYWKATLKYIPEHPIIGWGIGTTQQIMARSSYAFVTHNDYLRILLETGFLGLAAYLFFLGRLAWQVFRRIRYEQLWYVNYPMLIAVTYFIIISLPQNIYDHLVNLPLFFSLVAISYRLVEFEQLRYRGAQRQETMQRGQDQKRKRLLKQLPIRR